MTNIPPFQRLSFRSYRKKSRELAGFVSSLIKTKERFTLNWRANRSNTILPVMLSLWGPGGALQNWTEGSMAACAHTQDHKIDRKTQWEHEVNILSLLSLQVGHNKAREKTESCYPGQSGHQNQIFTILCWASSVDDVSWNQVITHYHTKEWSKLHQE